MSKMLRRRMVDELSEKLQGQSNVVLLDTDGLTAQQATELRSQLRESEARVRHVKNAVAVHALKKMGVEGFEPHLGGMNAFVYGPDPLAIAKKIYAFREKAQKPAVKAAIIEGKLVDAKTVEDLAKLPSREEVLASFFSALQAVTQKFVATLNEIPRSFVGTLQAYVDKDKKE